MKNIITSRYSSERNVILIIIAILILVGIMGYLAMHSLNTVVMTSANRDLPNQKIVLLKEIFGDISDAQSSVSSYTLSRDEQYLEPFYNSIKSIDFKMDSVRSLYDGDVIANKQLDSLNIFLEEKFKILNGRLQLENDDKITASLKKISEGVPLTLINPNEGSSSKSNILSRMFKKEKPANNTAAFDKTILQKKIALVKNEQLQQISKIRAEELELNRLDKQVTDKIRSILFTLEQKETLNLADQATLIEKQSRDTTLSIAWFSLVVGLLLFLSIYVVLRYVKKNNDYNKALEIARIEAERLAKAKENFLANMSHEIRTPMNAISGFSSLLLDKIHKPEEREQLEIIRRSSDHLLEVINSILDYSKLQSGKLHLVNSNFSPANAIEDVIMMLRPAAQQKKLDLLYFPENIPAFVNGDALRLRQILINIIGNAIKFTDHGKIEVVVKGNIGDEHIELEFKVEDTGIGIEADELVLIFEDFEQGNKQDPARYGGTGLGLSITSKLVKLFGGGIEVESVPGEGTIMRFHLILDKADVDEKHLQPVKQTPDKMFEGMRFLIVDDEKYNRALLASVFKKWNAKYDEVANGIEVLDIMARFGYDAVLMDIRMHGMGGLEAARMIRNDTGLINSTVPIIAVSAATSEKDRKDCKDAGINDFISKPFTEQELKTTLARHVFGKHLPHLGIVDLNQSYEQPQKIEIPAYSLDELRKMADGDQNFIHEMIISYIEAAENGVRDMENCLQKNDRPGMIHFAHKLAAPTRHMEAMEIYDLLKQIENMDVVTTTDDILFGWFEKVKVKLADVITSLKNDVKEIEI